MRYDTSEIRRAAKQIKQCANELNSSTAPVLKRIQQEIPDFFEGDAADALQRKLRFKVEDAKSIHGALCNLSGALICLAVKLEEADRRVSEKMK